MPAEFDGLAHRVGRTRWHCSCTRICGSRRVAAGEDQVRKPAYSVTEVDPGRTFCIERVVTQLCRYCDLVRLTVRFNKELEVEEELLADGQEHVPFEPSGKRLGTKIRRCSPTEG